MKEEFIVEEGIVLQSLGKYSEIILENATNCHECSARLICKSRGDTTKIITAHDPFGARPGDKVKIAIGGSTILKSAFLLYGLPVLIFIISITAAYSLEFMYPSNEFMSFVIAILITGIYYTLFSFASKKFFRFSNPKIISIFRTDLNN